MRHNWRSLGNSVTGYTDSVVGITSLILTYRHGDLGFAAAWAFCRGSEPPAAYSAFLAGFFAAFFFGSAEAASPSAFASCLGLHALRAFPAASSTALLSVRISVMRITENSCRKPRLRREFLRRRFLNAMTLSPRSWFTTTPASGGARRGRHADLRIVTADQQNFTKFNHIARFARLAVDPDHIFSPNAVPLTAGLMTANIVFFLRVQIRVSAPEALDRLLVSLVLLNSGGGSAP